MCVYVEGGGGAKRFLGGGGGAETWLFSKMKTVNLHSRPPRHPPPPPPALLPVFSSNSMVLQISANTKLRKHRSTLPEMGEYRDGPNPETCMPEVLLAVDSVTVSNQDHETVKTDKHDPNTRQTCGWKLSSKTSWSYLTGWSAEVTGGENLER